MKSPAGCVEVLRVIVRIRDACIDRGMKGWNQPLAAPDAGCDVDERQAFKLRVGKARHGSNAVVSG